MGLLGQGTTCDSNRVWITKTHYPQDFPGSTPFKAHKMIVITRNPIDVIPSYANLANLRSHSLEINEQYHVDFPEFWDQWVRQMTLNLRDNHNVVLDSIAEAIPTFFMRYEDLKINPLAFLTDLFCFLLDVPSIAGTVVERRINEVTQAGFSKVTAYKLKSTASSLNRNAHMYNTAQIDYMKAELANMIRFWKYDG